MVEMRDVGGGRLELVFILGKLLQSLARYANSGLFFMKSDAFLCRTLSFMRSRVILKIERTVMIAFHEGWVEVVLVADFFAGVLFTVEGLEVLGALAWGEADVFEDMVIGRLGGWGDEGRLKFHVGLLKQLTL